MLTQPGTSITFIHPSPSVLALDEEGDASEQATTYLVMAQGETSETDTDDTEPPPLTARADNADLLSEGFPALWRTDASNHSSVSMQATLDGYATSGAAAYRDVVREWPITVAADDTAHPYGTYRVGDTVQVKVTGDPWIPDGSYTQRIIDLSVDGNKVTLKVSAVT